MAAKVKKDTPTVDYSFVKDAFISQTIKHETGNDKTGAYTNDPKDAGGETKWGISKRAHPSLNIKALTYKQAVDIYKSEYWNKMYDRVLDMENSTAIAFKLFDMGVLMGPKTAVKALQRALKVKDDGLIGVLTLNALKGLLKSYDNVVYDAYINQLKKRVAWLTVTKPSNLKYIKGWLNRINYYYGVK